MEKQRTTRSTTTRQRSADASGATSQTATSAEELGGFGDDIESSSAAAGSESLAFGGTASSRVPRTPGTTGASGSRAAAGGSQSRSSGVVDRVKDRATAQLNTQKGRAVAGLDSVAQAVRQTTQQLRSEQHDTVAEYVEKAADQLERFSSRMRDTDAADMLRNVQEFARRQPAIFIGGSFAVGLLAARFLRSSQDSGEYAARDDAGRDYTMQRNVRSDRDDVGRGAY